MIRRREGNQKIMEQVLRSAFISYSRLSERFVQQIVDDLRRCGVEDVWWDDHLTGGQDWWQRILEQIRQADVLVCLVDVGASESLAVRREYKYANDLGKTIIPILLTEDINVSQLPDELAGKQYVDYRPEILRHTMTSAWRFASYLQHSLYQPRYPPSRSDLVRQLTILWGASAVRKD